MQTPLNERLSRIRENSPRVVRFDTNPAADGRDFVIGDVHGSFDDVWAGMKAVRFNPGTDRIFSAGDLIDRGPDSMRAGKFLALPYVYAISGNHEADLVDLYIGQEDPAIVVEALARINWNGMKWLSGASQSDLEPLLEAFAALPLVMEIKTARGLVGMVHGEVPIGWSWQNFCNAIEDGDPDAIKSCLTGRDRINGGIQDVIKGVDRVYAGHTPQFAGVNRFGNVFAIDTGAVFKELLGKPEARLTMAHLACKTGDLLTKKNHQELAAPGAGPFGVSGLAKNPRP